MAEDCITLQEECGVDVNLLLFLLWHAGEGRRLTVADVERLEAEIAPWRGMTVVPLRTIRRALKSQPALVEPGRAEAFRTRIKAVELEAERLQQEAMYAGLHGRLLGEGASSVRDAAAINIAAYASICRVEFAGPAVETLLAALQQLSAAKD